VRAELRVPGRYRWRVRGIGAVVQVGYLLAAEGLPDPSALGVAHVPDQAEKADQRDDRATEVPA
jgi:hypothetical protein